MESKILKYLESLTLGHSIYWDMESKFLRYLETLTTGHRRDILGHGVKVSKFQQDTV